MRFQDERRCGHQVFWSGRQQRSQLSVFRPSKNFFQGVHMTALREIKLLRELHHPRIVELLDIFEHKNNLCLVLTCFLYRFQRSDEVFEYLESDLEAVVQDPSLILSSGDIKSYLQMCLESVAFIHSQGVFHRDIKPNNLLISKTGTSQQGKNRTSLG